MTYLICATGWRSQRPAVSIATLSASGNHLTISRAARRVEASPSAPDGGICGTALTRRGNVTSFELSIILSAPGAGLMSIFEQRMHP